MFTTLAMPPRSNAQSRLAVAVTELDFSMQPDADGGCSAW
jgi:hypothetical protein